MSAGLVFDKISVRIAQIRVIDTVSAAFAPGLLTGIVGPNGAGKTTLLRAGIGLLPLSAGGVVLGGKPLSQWRRAEMARQIAYLPQSSEAKWPMTAFDVALLGRIPHRGRFAPPSPADYAAVEAALTRCDAQQFAARKMDALSAGERARVLLARAMATGAPVLLADEPAAFLDPAHQFALMDMLQAEAARGTAVAVTLHDLALAEGFCDHLLVLEHGRAICQGPPKDVLNDEILAKVFSLTVAPDRNNRRLSNLRKI